MEINKELELEAEKYADDLFGFSNENHLCWEDCQRHFINGVTSKYVEKQKLEFAIEQLKSLGQVHSEKAMSQRTKFRIKQLEEQIQQLGDETTNT